MSGAYLRSAGVFLLWAGTLPAVRAADAPLSPQGDAAVEIRQRLIDTGRDDETTVIEVLVRNKGKQPAEDVAVRGPFPKGHQLRSVDPPTEKSALELIWNLGRLTAGEEKKIRLQFAPSADGAAADLKVDLRVTFRGGAAVILETPAKQLPPRLAAAVPESAVAGVPVAVKIQITNCSARPVKAVVLQASLGAGLTHVGGRELENVLGPFEAGQTRTIRLELIPTRAGELRGKVRVRSEGSGWAEQDIILTTRDAGLAVSAAAPPECEAKAPLPITFGVRNDSAVTTPRVRLLVRLPKGFTFESALGGTYVADEHCVLFEMGDLKAGERRAARVAGTTAGPGEQSFNAVVSSATGEHHSHLAAVQVRDSTAKPPSVGRKEP